MKLYAQQGYGTGSNGGRISSGLSKGYIQGAILSPRDCPMSRIEELLSQLRSDSPDADLLFDPQYYATLFAWEDSCRLGKLDSGEYGYFRPRRRAELESESTIREDIRSCLEVQNNLAVSAVVSPNIVVGRSLDSIEAVISKNFLRNVMEVWSEVGDDRPVYATLAIDAEALQDRRELDDFLTDITMLERPPYGFYILVNNLTSSIDPKLIDHRTLAGWMLLNRALSVNGFRVVNGFSDILTPFLSAAGGTAGATGWWSNLKVFSLDRFQANNGGGGRRPVYRYLSKTLLNSIRFDELQSLRDRFPAVLNDLECDEFYRVEEGSTPEGQEQEILQSWEAIASFAGVDEDVDIDDCGQWLADSASLYALINATPGLRLLPRSNGAHIEALQDGLRLYAELSQIDLG